MSIAHAHAHAHAEASSDTDQMFWLNGAWATNSFWLFEVIYSIQFNLFCWKSAEKSCLHAEASWHWPNVLPRRSLRQKFLLTVFENTLSQANLFLALNETVFGINYISGGHWHCAKIMCDPISISSICFRWIKPKMPDFFCHLFSLSLFTHCLFKLLR